jgi:hypothetical protein
MQKSHGTHQNYLITDAIALYEIKPKVGVTSSTGYAKKLEIFATVTSSQIRFASESCEASRVWCEILVM